jgi:hypothetical protein
LLCLLVFACLVRVLFAARLGKLRTIDVLALLCPVALLIQASMDGCLAFFAVSVSIDSKIVIRIALLGVRYAPPLFFLVAVWFCCRRLLRLGIVKSIGMMAVALLLFHLTDHFLSLVDFPMLYPSLARLIITA